MGRDSERLRVLAAEPSLREILLANAWRGVQLQLVLRCVLALFVVLTVVLVAPQTNSTACRLVAVAYVFWTLAVALAAWAWRYDVIRWIGFALLVDLAVLAVLCVLASAANAQSWTTDVLVMGYFLVPLIAATQLRPWVCAVIAIPTVFAYFATSAGARNSNGDEPWTVIALSTLILAGLGVGSVLLSRVARARVLDISTLASDRAQLMADSLQIEERERRSLAENLHDGALQYVLAARQEMDDVGTDPLAALRVSEALGEASRLLRSTTAELHPAVLEQAGLAAALGDLATTVGARNGLVTSVDSSRWPADCRTNMDALLLTTARELITNVVKHAGAAHAMITVSLVDGVAELVVEDDGRGIEPSVPITKLAEGHIGIESRRVRLESAGGSLILAAGESSGTRVVTRVPATLNGNT